MTYAISAITRPHFAEDCWCHPAVCDDCGGAAHRIPDVMPDEQLRMAIFSDQRIQMPV